jgi:peptidyl-prolyl cis-trans isomerase D
LQKPDGSLDAEAYKALVGSQGMTPEGFEANLRRELALNQVLGSVSSTSFTTAAQLQQAMDALYQRREIQVARFDASAFVGKVQPTEAELKAFYESHTSQFKQPEAATVEYVQLDLATVEGIVLSEDDLRTYYKENAARLAGPKSVVPATS